MRVNKDVSNNIPLGYKKGKHYIIPEHWDDLVISDVVKFSGGAQPPRSEFINYKKEGYVRLIQIRDYKTNDYITYIPKEKARKLCDETDVMIGRYGPPIFQILRGIKGAYNVALMKAIPNENKLLKDYLYYYLQNETLFILIDRLSRRTSGQTGVDIDALNNFPFPLPPIVEQEKIIGIIKTWERSIDLVEQLIKMKRLQRKGLVKKLLTGEIRLAGYEEEWKEINLEKIAKVSIGLVTTMTKNYVDEGIPLIRNSDILPNKFKKELIKLDTEFANKNKGRMLKKGDIVTVHTGEVGVSAVIGEELGGALGFATLNTRILNDQFEPKFISYYFNSDKYKNFALRMSTGDGRNNFNLKDFKKSIVPFISLKEQREIVEVLSTIDKEIELYEMKVSEYKQQMKGIMQLLLTGKVRVRVDNI